MEIKCICYKLHQELFPNDPRCANSCVFFLGGFCTTIFSPEISIRSQTAAILRQTLADLGDTGLAMVIQVCTDNSRIVKMMMGYLVIDM